MEPNIGSNRGQVHRLPEGQGLSEILEGDRALDTYARVWQVDQAKQARQEQERTAKRNAAMAALKGVKPDWFYKHDGEMAKVQQEVFDRGAALLAKYDDPFTATAPEAIEWQKDIARLQAMSNASMQIKDQWTAYQKQALGANPDDYDARSLANAMAYFDTPLSEIIETGATPPMLMKKKPFLQMNEFIGKNMATWQSTRGEQPPTDAEIYDFVTGLASEPANMEQFVTGYGSKLAQLDADERKRIADAAANQGREPWQQMAFEDAKRWQKKGKPFDMQGELKTAAQMAEGGVDYAEWQTPEGFGKAPKKGSKEAAIKAAVDATFNSDDRWMTVYDREGAVPRGREETDGEYVKRVKAYMATQIDPLVGIATKSGRTERGADDAASVKGRNAFIEDMRSGDWQRIQGAANVLVGTRWANNLDIQDATVTQGPNGFRLELDLGTNVSLKDVREQVSNPDTGLSSERTSVEDRQGRRVVTIDLSEGAISNQTLARLIDNTTKSTGKPYDPTLTERTKKQTFEESMRSAGTAVPGAAKPTTTFNVTDF